MAHTHGIDFPEMAGDRSQRPTEVRRGLKWACLALALSIPIGMQTAFAASVCDGVAGNLIQNCGFESGAVGAPPSQSSLQFTSQYTYTSNLVPAGTFYIGSNPDAYNPFFASFSNGPPAAPNSGSFEMIVNGASAANTKVWEESAITVVPNATYFFSVFVQSVTDISAAVLDFSANGVQLGSTFTADSTTGTEQEFVATWFSGTNTTVDLALVDQDTAAGGNDFALDDFEFSTTAPAGGTGVGGTTGPVGAPEPSSILVLLSGIAALRLRRRRSKSAFS